MMQKKLLLIVFLWFGGASGSRVRRHLVFTEGSRLFFSIDVRDNIFDHSNFFAHVFGLKMDWGLPTKIVDDSKKGKIQRRDLYTGMKHLLRGQNLNETSCIRKFFCEASVTLPKSNHFLAQLYEIILSAKDEDLRDTFKMDGSEKQCTEILNSRGDSECPLSLLSILTGSEFNFNVMVN